MNTQELDISKLIKALERLQLLDRPCFFYRTPTELHRVISPFIRIGLKRNEKCLYIVSDDEPEVVLEFLEKGGIDSSAALAQGALEVIKADDFYPKNEPYTLDRLQGLIEKAINDAHTAGFSSLRLVNDMKWIHNLISGTERLVEHVAQMNDFYEMINLMVLRLYNSTQLTSEELIEVIRIHPKVIFGGAVCTNFSYRSKENLSRTGRAEFELEHLLCGILEIEKRFEDLQTENAMLKGVLDNSPDVIFLKDLEGRYLLMNQAGAAFLGKTIEDIVGHSDRELFSEEDAKKIKALNREVVECGKPLTIEKTLSANGVTRVFLATKCAYCDQQGNIVGTFGISRDITDRKQAEEELRESEKRYRRLFETETDAILLVDRESFRFLDANMAAQEMYGYSLEEFLSLTALDITVEPEKTRQAIAANRVRSSYRLHRKKDGTVFPVEISGSYFESQGRDVHVAAIRDITDWKQAEGEILAYQEQLRYLASELALTEERERRRIATALHDQIGQTLALANIKLGALRELDVSGGLSAAINSIREMVNGAIKNTHTLLFEISPPVLYELGLEAALASLAEYFSKEHGLPIDFSDDKQPKPLTNDISILLFQSVRELLVNAAKHSQAKRVTINSRRQETSIRIQVEDDGVGFNVRENPTPKGPGHGFGLFSIRERIRNLGGSVEIESKPGCGTRVSLTAPLMTSEKQKECPE